MKKFDAITITCSALEFVTIVELCVASINRKGLSDRKKKFRCCPQKGVWVFCVIFGCVKVSGNSIREVRIAVITTE